MTGGTEQVMSFMYKGYLVEVDGVWDRETPVNEFDFYDVFVDGVCVTLGEPFYDTKPTKAQVLEVVDEYFKHFKPKIQRAGLKKPYYIIQNVIDRTLYWSNKWGWGSKQGCYKTKDIVGVHLPVEGQWVLERI